MNDMATTDRYGALTEPATVRIQRLLPGPIDRIWAYLTESELRRRWLASGEMTMAEGAPFELVWRNDELTDPPGDRPDSMAGEHRMQSRITELDPPRRIAFTWSGGAEVTIDLEAQGATPCSPSPTAACPTARTSSGSAPAGTPISTSSRRGCAATSRRRSGTAGGSSAPSTRAASRSEATRRGARARAPPILRRPA